MVMAVKFVLDFSAYGFNSEISPKLTMKNDTEWLERDDTMRDIDSNFRSIAETTTFHAHAEKNDDFPCKF